MRLQQEIQGAVSAGIAKAAPPVAVASMSLFGVALSDWVYITAIIYAVLQTAYLVWKWVREWRGKRK